MSGDGADGDERQVSGMQKHDRMQISLSPTFDVHREKVWRKEKKF